MSEPDPPTPRVGIFWLYCSTIIADSVPVAEGEEYGDFVNGRSDHCTHWAEVQRRMPALRRYEYEQVPRGRVIYNKLKDSFTVFGNERLLRDAQQQALVLSTFQLPRDRSHFRFDEHYGPVPGMVED